MKIVLRRWKNSAWITEVSLWKPLPESFSMATWATEEPFPATRQECTECGRMAQSCILTNLLAHQCTLSSDWLWRREPAVWRESAGCAGARSPTSVGAIRGTHTSEVNPHCTGHGTGSVGTFNRNAKALRGAHLEIAAVGVKVLISRWFRTPAVAVVCTTSVLLVYPTSLTPDAIVAKKLWFWKSSSFEIW